MLYVYVDTRIGMAIDRASRATDDLGVAEELEIVDLMDRVRDSNGLKCQSLK